MDHYTTRIVENRIAIPEEMKVKYISTKGLAYIYHRQQERPFLMILNKHKVYEEDKRILKTEPPKKRRSDRRHFYASLIRTKVKEHTIKLPKESIKYLGTDNIELRIRKGLLEVWPKN